MIRPEAAAAQADDLTVVRYRPVVNVAVMMVWRTGYLALTLTRHDNRVFRTEMSPIKDGFAPRAPQKKRRNSKHQL